jgi:uncharacterized protein YndB with AHSA1/START domain
MTTTASHEKHGQTGAAASEFGVVTGPDTVVFERLLPGPIERVWAYLTESDKRAKWFAAGDMELRVGGKVELIFRNSELAPAGEPVPERYRAHSQEIRSEGRVTRCEPPRLLSFLWGGANDGSEITFELSPQGTDVRLVLTHSRLANRAAMVDVSGGWHIHLRVLADQLRGRPKQPFWSTLEQLEAAYEQRIPKRPDA